MNLQDLKNTMEYIHSEINRIETIAGTLSTIEQEHFHKLTKFDHKDLTDVAVEEQSGARQLGTVKQICLSLAQKLEGIQNAIDRGELTKGESNRVQNH